MYMFYFSFIENFPFIEKIDQKVKTFFFCSTLNEIHCEQNNK